MATIKSAIAVSRGSGCIQNGSIIDVVTSYLDIKRKHHRFSRKTIEVMKNRLVIKVDIQYVDFADSQLQK
jgi:hypothetical protein